MLQGLRLSASNPVVQWRKYKVILSAYLYVLPRGILTGKTAIMGSTVCSP
ncbi:Uncharacterised protein [Tatumella ptyseos]|uniref:Uncharacterized protein n=1 Tax=Tatumella ptyseos TaxID=82987 RepID=A0A2X5P8F1_9GAMM|nr:Uncharacterised protein [Tatumella ptyseos]